jgi:hypothetical protein
MLRALAIAVVLCSWGSLPHTAGAQTMPLNEFIATADRIPRNPTAFLRSDFRRLKREVEAGLSAIATAEHRAVQASQTPQTCMPDTFSFDGEDILRRLKAIPEGRRRSMTITDGLREIIRRQHPCPGG